MVLETGKGRLVISINAPLWSATLETRNKNRLWTIHFNQRTPVECDVVPYSPILFSYRHFNQRTPVECDLCWTALRT